MFVQREVQPVGALYTKAIRKVYDERVGDTCGHLF